jgi:hypothetical protein
VDLGATLAHAPRHAHSGSRSVKAHWTRGQGWQSAMIDERKTLAQAATQRQATQ